MTATEEIKHERRSKGPECVVFRIALVSFSDHLAVVLTPSTYSKQMLKRIESRTAMDNRGSLLHSFDIAAGHGLEDLKLEGNAIGNKVKVAVAAEQTRISPL